MSAYYNDNDAYCCRVLRKNIAAGHLPPGDVDERDIRDVQPDDLAGYRAIHLFAGIGGLALGGRMAGLDDDISICTGGFPCQDISAAGKRTGLDGAHSGLWAHMARLLGALQPRYVLVENVAALLERGAGRVLGALAALGYDHEWECIPAASLGAPHIRDRLFIVGYRASAPARRPARQRWVLAHAASRGQWPVEDHADRSAQQNGLAHPVGGCALVADADGERCAQQGRARPGPASDAGPERRGWWDVEPGVCRVADGVSHRVDRLRGLGNAVVPQAAAVALRRIAAYEQESPE